jgi:hypothetical protein
VARPRICTQVQIAAEPVPPDWCGVGVLTNSLISASLVEAAEPLGVYPEFVHRVESQVGAPGWQFTGEPWLYPLAGKGMRLGPAAG